MGRDSTNGEGESIGSQQLDRYVNDKKSLVGLKKQPKTTNKKSWQSDIAEPAVKLNSENYQKK